MPSKLPPSEFQGKIGPSGTYRTEDGRVLTAADKLRLTYRTGDPEGSSKEPDPRVFDDSDYTQE